MTVFYHLPFARGMASIVTVTAPQGRYSAPRARYSVKTPVCRVVLFRDGALADQASFFGTGGVWRWIEQELGPLQPHQLPVQAGQTTAQANVRLAERLATAGLV